MATFVRVPMDNGDRFTMVLPVLITNAIIGDFIELDIGVCAVIARTWSAAGELVLDVLPGVPGDLKANLAYAKTPV
ncbi:MAG: hypothetical protein ACRDZ4_04720 [Egibacteraceae bacterium]